MAPSNAVIRQFRDALVVAKRLKTAGSTCGVMMVDKGDLALLCRAILSCRNLFEDKSIGDNSKRAKPATKKK